MDMNSVKYMVASYVHEGWNVQFFWIEADANREAERIASENPGVLVYVGLTLGRVGTEEKPRLAWQRTEIGGAR